MCLNSSVFNSAIISVAPPIYQNTILTTDIQYTGTLSNIPLYTSKIVEAVDLVLSDKFVTYLQNDLKVPVYTSVGKILDLVLGFFGVSSKDESLDKKLHIVKSEENILVPGKKSLRRTQETIEDTRPSQDLYFTNWPPFTFNQGLGSFQCKSIVQYFNHYSDNGTFIGADNLLMTLSLGQSCYLYETQRNCLNQHLGNLFDDSLTRDNVFGGNATIYASPPLMFKENSNILPVIWQFTLGSYSNLSNAFVEGIKSNMSALAACENNLYVRQSVSFGVLVGLGTCSFFGLMCCFSSLMSRKSGKDEQGLESELSSVIVDEVTPLRQKKSFL